MRPARGAGGFRVGANILADLASQEQHTRASFRIAGSLAAMRRFGDAASGRERHTLQGHSESVQSVAWSPLRHRELYVLKVETGTYRALTTGQNDTGLRKVLEELIKSRRVMVRLI